MATFKAITPVSVMSRRLRRSFEKDERVTEAEIELVVEHVRKCFEPEPEPTASKAPDTPESGGS